MYIIGHKAKQSSHYFAPSLDLKLQMGLAIAFFKLHVSGRDPQGIIFINLNRPN